MVNWDIGKLGHWDIGKLGHWQIGKLANWDIQERKNLIESDFIKQVGTKYLDIRMSSSKATILKYNPLPVMLLTNIIIHLHLFFCLHILYI